MLHCDGLHVTPTVAAAARDRIPGEGIVSMVFRMSRLQYDRPPTDYIITACHVRTIRQCMVARERVVQPRSGISKLYSDDSDGCIFCVHPAVWESTDSNHDASPRYSL